MGSCASCCRGGSSKKLPAQYKEDVTQIEEEKISAEKVAEEQINLSADKPKTPDKNTSKERLEKNMSNKRPEKSTSKERPEENMSKERLEKSTSKERLEKSKERPEKSKERPEKSKERPEKSKERPEENMSKERAEAEQARKLSKESDRKNSLFRTDSIINFLVKASKERISKQHLSKQSTEERGKVSDQQHKKKKKGKSGSRENEGGDHSGSEPIDYWLTAEERQKLASKEAELPVDKTLENFSIIQPAPADHVAVPLRSQTSLQKREQPPTKRLTKTAVWTSKSSSGEAKQAETYGVADRPRHSEAHAVVDRSRHSEAHGVMDRPRYPEAYGVADRPFQSAPSARKPVAPQAYGVADRPVQQNVPMTGGGRHSPVLQEAYGVMDRPLPKTQPTLPRSYGVVDRQGVADSGSQQRRPPMLDYYQQRGHEGTFHQDQTPQISVNYGPHGSSSPPRFQSKKPSGSPKVRSYKLYGGNEIRRSRSNERSEYGF